jgi:hypothetical protein
MGVGPTRDRVILSLVHGSVQKKMDRCKRNHDSLEMSKSVSPAEKIYVKELLKRKQIC